MKRLYNRVKNLKYRYKLTLLVIVAGLIPVLIIVFYMQNGMTNILHENEVDSLENTLEQSVEAIENQEMIYENLVDYLSYSQDLRSILTTEPESDYEAYVEYANVADPLLQMPQIYHKEIRGITLYSESIQVAHGNTLMPLSEAEGESWYHEMDDNSSLQWSFRRGSAQEITACRRFYDDETTAVLVMTLDYQATLEPFSSQLRDNTEGLSSTRMETLFIPVIPWMKATRRQSRSRLNILCRIIRIPPRKWMAPDGVFISTARMK